MLDSQTSGIDWDGSGLQPSLPWLRDIFAPAREQIEFALLGIEAEGVRNCDGWLGAEIIGGWCGIWDSGYRAEFGIQGIPA